MAKQRKFRAWYTHPWFVMTLAEVKRQAQEHGVKLADPDNPTPKELAKVFTEANREMSDPWEVTANGRCEVEEIE